VRKHRLNPIQSGLSDQRQKIADDAQSLLQRLLDSYRCRDRGHAGPVATSRSPLAVIDAFNDVQRARADQQRARNEAEAYRNDILPAARAEADRVSQEAQAYKEEVLNRGAQRRGQVLGFRCSLQQVSRCHCAAALPRHNGRSPEIGGQNTDWTLPDALVLRSSHICRSPGRKPLSPQLRR